jgi:hypothetical protein
MFVVFTVLSAIIGLTLSQSSSTVMTSPSTSPTRVETWDDLVVTAVRMITELSRVCIVASRRDYTLDISRSYTYIKYSSYRATLTQATDAVDNAFRKTESSMSRVQMITGQVPSQLKTALSILFDASVEERQIFLPNTLKDITRKAKDITSISETVSAELAQLAAFFDELLRVVQPTPRPSTTSGPSGSTTTQANRSPLDIDHATAISNILAYAKSSITKWNQMAQLSSKLIRQADGAAQFMSDRNKLLWTLGDIDETADFLNTLAFLYTEISMKIITSRTSTMASYLMLQSEEERLVKVQKVSEGADHNILIVQENFAQAMIDHETHNKERNTEYDRLAATPST